MQDSTYQQIRKSNDMLRRINVLPIDRYAKDKLETLAKTLLPAPELKEFFTILMPSNKTRFSDREIINYLEGTEGMYDSFLMKAWREQPKSSENPETLTKIPIRYLYSHFRYFPTENNYRVVIDEKAKITIGRRTRKMGFMTSHTLQEFNMVAGFIKDSFDDAEFDNSRIFEVNVREFDYSWLVQDKIAQIVEGITRKPKKESDNPKIESFFKE